MKQIEITGRLVTKCLIELKITEITNKLKEVENDIEEIERLIDSISTDYDSCLRASRFLR